MSGGEYGFGYWLEITDSASPSPGGTLGKSLDGKFHAALHVANGPNLIWTSVTLTTMAIEPDQWYYVVGSFRSGRRGEIPEMTICVDNICQTDGLRYHSNDILGYRSGTESGFHLGQVYSTENSFTTTPLTALAGKVDELIIKPSYMSKSDIISLYNTYSNDNPKPTISVVDPKNFYDPLVAITLKAELSILEQQNDGATWSWHFTSPTAFQPTSSMVSTSLSDRSISFVPNALEAGITYKYTVCVTIPPNGGGCSSEHTFIAAQPPAVNFITIECFQNCNNGVWTAEESQIRITASATGSAGAQFEYNYFTENPITQDLVPITAGFTASSVFETQNGLPNIGEFPTQQVTIYAEVTDTTTGFVGQGFRVIVLHPPTDPSSGVNGFEQAVQRQVSVGSQLQALGNVGGGGTNSRGVSVLAINRYLSTYIQLANALMNENNNRPGVLEPTSFSTLSQFLTPVPTEASVITNTIELMKRIVSTQLVARHMTWRLESSYLRCIDLLHEGITELSKDATQQDLYSGIQDLRMMYLNFITKYRAISAPAYLIHSSKFTKGVAEKVKYLTSAFPQEVVTAIPNGEVRLRTVANNHFLVSTKEIGVSLTLTPNVFTTAVFTLITDTSSSVTDVVDIQMTEGTVTNVVANAYDEFDVKIPCATCLTNDAKVYRCGILPIGSTQWIELVVTPIVYDGSIRCQQRGGTAVGRIAAFHDAVGIRTPTPGGPPTPEPILTEPPAFTPQDVQHVVSTPFKEFNEDVFISGLKTSLNIASGNIKITKYCSFDSLTGLVDMNKCNNQQVNRVIETLTAGDSTLVIWKLIGITKTTETELLAVLQDLARACSEPANKGPLEQFGICPAPGTTIIIATQVINSPSPDVVRTTSSDGDDWETLGPVIGASVLTVICCIGSIIYCLKKQRCCFANLETGGRFEENQMKATRNSSTEPDYDSEVEHNLPPADLQGVCDCYNVLNLNWRLVVFLFFLKKKDFHSNKRQQTTTTTTGLRSVRMFDPPFCRGGSAKIGRNVAKTLSLA